MKDLPSRWAREGGGGYLMYVKAFNHMSRLYSRQDGKMQTFMNTFGKGGLMVSSFIYLLWEVILVSF